MTNYFKLLKKSTEFASRYARDELQDLLKKNEEERLMLHWAIQDKKQKTLALK